MRIKLEYCDPNIPLAVASDIQNLISGSLSEIVTRDEEFVVNDKIYYRAKRTGGISPCVVNEATFLSKGFQKNLASKEYCNGETKLDGQSIDGFIRVPFKGKADQIREHNFWDVLQQVRKQQKSNATHIFRLFELYYGMFVMRSKFLLTSTLDISENFLQKVDVETTFKVGVEFETGNIASSFRAFSKLSLLYQQEEIDIGVFVTSSDKAGCAARIWPKSNRNGSFEELQKREYLTQIGFPLIAIGFAPDRFYQNAKFLAKNGTLYELETTDGYDDTGSYEVLIGKNGEEILSPIGET